MKRLLERIRKEANELIKSDDSFQQTEGIAILKTLERIENQLSYSLLN